MSTMKTLTVVIALALQAGACGSDGPEARVTLTSRPVLTGLVFHADCVSIWLLEASIRVSADLRESLTLDHFAFHFAGGRVAAGQDLAGQQLNDRFGEDADRIPAGGARDYRLGVGWPAATARRVTLTGEVSGVGESGPWHERFAFPDLPVAIAPLGPGIGDCSIPPP